MSAAQGWRPLARVLWSLTRFQLGRFLLATLLSGVMWSLFVVPGLLGRAFFDLLAGKAQLPFGIVGLIALLAMTEVVRAALMVAESALGVTAYSTVAALMRENLLERVLGRPGARAVAHSPGEAVSRFRDDVEHLLRIIGDVLGLVGQVAFAAAALTLMMRTDPRITLVVILPMLAVGLGARAAGRGFERFRKASREAAARVSAALGEAFGAVQAIKVAGAEDRVAEHLGRLNERRRRAAVRDALFARAMDSLFQNAVSLGMGAILLLAAGSMRAGEFTVGDFALFTYLLGFVTGVTANLGGVLGRVRQARVSLERLEALLQGEPLESLSRRRPLFTARPARSPLPERAPKDRLQCLEVEGLTCRYPDTGRGVEGVSFALERGSFTVITGRIGSGKTTLLRGLLGLMPSQAGEIRWNGRRVEDPGAFFVPPRAAYTAQVPLVFSETLRDNILLGLPEEDVDLPRAVHLAVLEQDLAAMPEGLETVVGAKGVRLSGGQAQRTAAARMFVRDPELLVFDDLSSALDVETERLLWRRLFERSEDRPTCLVVSHSRTVLSQADQVIVLKEGRLHARGRLEDLLRDCEEMRELWAGRVGVMTSEAVDAGESRERSSGS